MTPIENKSKIRASLDTVVCKILGGHFGTSASFYFVDPKNPRCSVCGTILTKQNHFLKKKKEYIENQRKSTIDD